MDPVVPSPRQTKNDGSDQEYVEVDDVNEGEIEVGSDTMVRAQPSRSCKRSYSSISRADSEDIVLSHEGEDDVDELDEEEEEEEENNEGVWEVQSIVDVKNEGTDKEMYKVDWAPRSDGRKYRRSWEPMSSLSQCDWAIKEFKERRVTKKKRA